MTRGSSEALKDFNAHEDKSQSVEAFESRMRFIESVHYLLGIALEEQAIQFQQLVEAHNRGDSKINCKYYVISSDWDEKRAQRGEQYLPTVMLRFKNNLPNHPMYQINPTDEMLIAIPTQDDFSLDTETDITDIELGTSVFVYWKTVDGHNDTYEVAPAGVRKATDLNEEDNTIALFDHIDAQDFSRLQTANALMARLREDIRNLTLEPHFTVVTDANGNEITRY